MLLWMPFFFIPILCSYTHCVFSFTILSPSPPKLVAWWKNAVIFCRVLFQSHSVWIHFLQFHNVVIFSFCHRMDFMHVPLFQSKIIWNIDMRTNKRALLYAQHVLKCMSLFQLFRSRMVRTWIEPIAFVCSLSRNWYKSHTQ